MYSSDKDKIIERIRKLVNLAENEGAFEGEANNAMKFARQLMDKYNITEAEAAVHEAESQGISTAVEEVEAHRRCPNIEDYFLELAWVCCNLCDVRFFWRTGWQQKKGMEDKVRLPIEEYHKRTGYPGMAYVQRLIFYGLKHDVAVAVALYRELVVSVRTLMRFRFGRLSGPARDYARGVVTRLIERSQVIKHASTQQEQTTAIVLRKDVVLQQYADEKLNLTTVDSKRKIRDWEAYCQGHTDGNKVSLDERGLGGGESQGVLDG